MGGLNGIDKMLKEKGSISGDANNYKDNGIYDFDKDKSAFTNIPLNYGTMLVYGGSVYKTQLVSSIESGESHIRTLSWNGSWSPWKKITS